MAWHRGWGFSPSKKLRKVDQDVRQTPPHTRDPSSDCVSPELVQQREGSTSAPLGKSLSPLCVLPLSCQVFLLPPPPPSVGVQASPKPPAQPAPLLRPYSTCAHAGSMCPVLPQQGTRETPSDTCPLYHLSPPSNSTPRGDKPATGLEADCEDATSPFRQDGVLGKGMAGCVGTRLGRAGWKGSCTPVHRR